MEKKDFVVTAIAITAISVGVMGVFAYKLAMSSYERGKVVGAEAILGLWAIEKELREKIKKREDKES